MNLYEKLLEMQRRVDAVVKDGKNVSDKYDFASDENVLDTFRPLMDEFSLLLIPSVGSVSVREGTTRSGTARFLTEMHFNMIWHDVESGEELIVPWYAQGVDLAGEKGVGKAATYGEKYFLLKFFHVATKKDDPDNDRKTTNGEKQQRGSAAAKETADFHRGAIVGMLSDLYNGDEGKMKEALIAMTKSDKRGYPGTDNAVTLSDAAAAVVYAKIKKAYESRTGHEYNAATVMLNS